MLLANRSDCGTDSLQLPRGAGLPGLAIVSGNLPNAPQRIVLWTQNLLRFPSKRKLLACWSGGVEPHFVMVREFTGRTISLLVCLGICRMRERRERWRRVPLVLAGSTSRSAPEEVFILFPSQQASLSDTAFGFQSCPSVVQVGSFWISLDLLLCLASPDLCSPTSERYTVTLVFPHVFPFATNTLIEQFPSSYCISFSHDLSTVFLLPPHLSQLLLPLILDSNSYTKLGIKKKKKACSLVFFEVTRQNIQNDYIRT